MNMKNVMRAMKTLDSWVKELVYVFRMCEGKLFGTNIPPKG